LFLESKHEHGFDFDFGGSDAVGIGHDWPHLDPARQGCRHEALPLVVAVRAVCLAPRAVPTFFRAPPLLLAAVFFVCTLLLAYFSNARPAASTGSVLEGAAVTAPAAPVDNSPAAQIPGNAPAAKTDNSVPPAPAK